ncbi:MAG: hypothetical protein R3181_08800 [Rubricoccaceae bacterium]|nr:hypothetical protein [Rubricoccaceae bacterium]
MPRSSRGLALLALLALGLAACDDASVEPVLDTGRPFTLWGALDPRADLQGLRVIPIRLQLDAEEGGPAEAVVTVEDLGTGEVLTLRDSLVRFSSGLTGSVYVGDFRPAYEGRYRVTATRDDGAASTAVVEVPPLTEPVVFLPQTIPGDVVSSVLWPEAPRVNAVTVTYLGRRADCSTDPVTLVLDEDEVLPAKIGWEVRLPLRLQREAVLAGLGTDRATILSVTLRGLVTDAEWAAPFGFSFDDEVLTEPTTLTNVENGFGFVGAGYATEVEWRLDDETLQSAGYQPQAFGSCG